MLAGNNFDIGYKFAQIKAVESEVFLVTVQSD